jgi:hypothetical protein
MNVNRPTKRPERFGGCHTQESVLKYMKDEGWILGQAACLNCNYRWKMLARPEHIKKMGAGVLFDKVKFEGQPCPKCGQIDVWFKIV